MDMSANAVELVLGTAMKSGKSAPVSRIADASGSPLDVVLRMQKELEK